MRSSALTSASVKATGLASATVVSEKPVSSALAKAAATVMLSRGSAARSPSASTASLTSCRGLCG